MYMSKPMGTKEKPDQVKDDHPKSAGAQCTKLKPPEGLAELPVTNNIISTVGTAVYKVEKT